MSAPPDPTQYRPNVGIALFHPRGLVWVGKRLGATPPFEWQMPQGGVDSGEEPRAAAQRAVAEEASGAP